MSGQEVVDGMTFTVVFTKEANSWTVIAPDVHPAHSWGPTLRTATKRIKEAIALVLDLPKGAEDSMELDASYRVAGMSEDLDGVVRDARDTRRQLKEAQQRADQALNKAIEWGQIHNLSMRDIATMTGVSHQRVAQITAGKR